MTTGIEFLKPIVKRKGRGPSEKPALFCTSLRLSKEVMDYFNTNYPFTKQAMMRQVLTEYINKQKLEKQNG
jgi:hypothetical protein